MTDHFNGLTEAEQERLAILVEGHGYESTNPLNLAAETNRAALERELGHVGHAVRRMEKEGDVNPLALCASAASKAKGILPYLHHQKD